MNFIIYFFFIILLSLIFFLLRILLNFLNLSLILEWILINLNRVNIEFFILLDWISCLFVSVVLLISAIIMVYRIIYIKGEIYLERFLLLVNLFILSIILIIIRPNLISILFGWDGLGLISYCLVIYYQNYSSYNSGIVTILCNRIGDIGLLIAIGFMFLIGSWKIYFLNNKFLLVLILILLASITKRAQIPFSVWLPIAISAPTPVSALVHSSTLVTAGIYLIIRFNKIFLRRLFIKILLYCSIFTIFISGLMANFENDLKKIIALSTLSQLGLIIIILSLGLELLSFFHLLIHAIFKSLLFICAGIIIHLINNNQDIRLRGKLNEYIPFTIIRFYICNLALIGFPFFSGFYSKDLIIEMIYLIKINLFLLIIILISLSFTVSYSLRLFYLIRFRQLKRGRFYYFKENILINLSILILIRLRVIRGSIIIWLFFYDNYFLFIIIFVKIITFIMLILGGIIIIFNVKNFLSLYFYRYFFRSMWFLNYIYFFNYKYYLDFGLKFYRFDNFWIEFIRKNFLLNSVKVIKIYLNNYKIYIFIFINLIYIFIFFNLS